MYFLYPIVGASLANDLYSTKLGNAAWFILRLANGSLHAGFRR